MIDFNNNAILKTAIVSLARTLIRAALRILPSRLGWLIVEESTARFHKTGKHFASIRLRPKSGAAAVYAPLDPIPTPATVHPAIIMQGPLAEQFDFTRETVRLYRHSMPDSPLIVSTWDDQPKERLAELRSLGATVVAGPKPSVAGRLNVNLQVTSTRRGLERAREIGCSHAAKTRTDQRLFAVHVLAGLTDIARAYPIVSHARPRERIVVMSRWTSRYCPLYLSDMFMFGRTDDLIDYWSPELDTSSLTASQYLAQAASLDDLKQIAEGTPEYFLIESYLRRIGDPAEFSLRYWWRLLAERFLVLDPHMLDFYWPKYLSTIDGADVAVEGQPIGTVLRFLDWLRLYHLMNDTTETPQLNVIGSPRNRLPPHLPFEAAPPFPTR
jgi:hypothetical protein